MSDKYVMMPVEPNEAMLDAMWNNVQQELEDSQLKVLYKALLAAAPKIEPQPVSDDANKVLIDVLVKIMNLEGTELNEWDAVDRLIPEICNSAHKALAAYHAAMGSKGE